MKMEKTNSRKKTFSCLFFQNNLKQDFLVKLNLNKEISWKQYFELTKILFGSFLLFQVNNFTSTTSDLACFLLTSPIKKYDSEVEFPIEEEESWPTVSYEELRSFLTEMKIRAKKRYVDLNDSNELYNLELKINHIDRLGELDGYKKGSYRQNKSSLIKKAKNIRNNIATTRETFVTAADLIVEYYKEFCKRQWFPRTFSIHWPELFILTGDIHLDDSMVSIPSPQKRSLEIATDFDNDWDRDIVTFCKKVKM